jgi:hypothetical protein
MSEVKHTPTPWIIEHGHMQQHTDIRYWQITDGQDAICNNQFCYAHDSEAKAAHIVKCVNMHDELVGALERAIVYMKEEFNNIDDTGEEFSIVEQIEQALKKAGAL